MISKSKVAMPMLAAVISTCSLVSVSEAQEVYLTNQGHTEILFGWNHSGVSRQHGEFTRVEGVLTLYPDRLEDSVVEATIDMSSLHTGFEPLDDRLKSSRWFDIIRFPKMEYKSTSVELTSEKTAKINGDLTLFGVTKPLVLEAELTHQGEHPVAAFIEYYRGE